MTKIKEKNVINAKTVMDVIEEIATDDNNEEFVIQIQLMLDSMKAKTYSRLLSTDKAHKEMLQKYKLLETQLESLTSEEEIKDKAEKMVSMQDEICWREKAISYLAGILDGYEVLRTFDVTNE